MIEGLVAEAYFQEWAGVTCVDGGWTGTGGADPAMAAYRKTRLTGLWPPGPAWEQWDELHLMTAIEFLFDVVSKPIDGSHHAYNNCGYHASKFSREPGRDQYRSEVNAFLGDLGDGFELDRAGLVVRTVPDGLGDLVAEAPSAAMPATDVEAIQHAIAKFRARGSSRLDQLDAIRTLVGLLEAIRPTLKTAFDRQDEADLFEIANRFNLRHAGAQQRSDYDESIFLPWVFYMYLAALNAAFRLIERNNRAD